MTGALAVCVLHYFEIPPQTADCFENVARFLEEVNTMKEAVWR
jgi:hypothetical protein